MNTFSAGDKFIWEKAKDNVMIVADTTPLFVIAESGGSYLYTECIKMDLTKEKT